MEITVFQSEMHHRSTQRYIIFGIFFTSLIFISLIYQNYIGAIVTLFLLGGYFYFSILNAQRIKISLHKDHIQIGNKTYQRAIVQGFTIELRDKEHNLKNIILFVNNRIFIHTCDEPNEVIREFSLLLSTYTQMTKGYTQSPIESFIRSLKI